MLAPVPQETFLFAVSIHENIANHGRDRDRGGGGGHAPGRWRRHIGCEWASTTAAENVYPALFSHCKLQSASVKEIIDVGIQNTMVPRLTTAAQQELRDAQDAIISLHLSDQSDVRKSVFERQECSLDSGAIYKMIKAKTQPSSPKAKVIWESYAPPRVQLFMWLLTRGRIQCRTVLFSKTVVDDPTCEICRASEESADHMVCGCNLAGQLWQRLQIQVNPGDLDIIHSWSPPPTIPREAFSSFLAICCWQLWKARNAFIFRTDTTSVQALLLQCKNAANQWAFRLPASKRHIAQAWALAFQRARQGEG
ncbi:uncharacterized protein LOC8068106 [Sorghum bicolor]|uniref:uncharacterized protein LOC8068106 n=1 Tax=Sorghum bicolor TaxID=4558 RepID=UPI000B425C47|nr:uncharacterized protein LOC8068106 [Sorghum bicolor]|eukprot:XP_002443394.2 uncharacterized protein LOC8068106 [Sorghum bicolor]